MLGANFELQQRVNRENELLRRLQKLSGKLLRQTDKELLLQEILHHATQFMGAANGGISLLDEKEPKWTVLRYGVGIQAARIGFRLPVTEGLAGEVWRTGRVQIVEDYRVWPHRVADPQLDRMTTLIMAPLQVSGKIVGMIQISWNDSLFPVKGETLAAFDQFVAFASIALENATLFQQVQAELYERRQAEEALKNEQAFTRAVMDSVPGMLYLYDGDGRLIRWNKRHETMTGYSADEIRGMHLMEWFAVDKKVQGMVVKEAAKAMQGNATEFRVDLRRKDGTPLTMFFTAVGLTIDDKPYLTGIGIDITRLTEAENALREVNETLERRVEERTQDLNALNQELTAMNEEMTAMNEELTAMNESLLHANDQLQQEVSERQRAENELTAALDHQKSMQDYLIQSEKMAALGGLVAGVAHEINTPVGVGVTAASHLKQITEQFRELCTTGAPRRKDMADYLEDMTEAADILLKNLERASQLIKSFKQVSVDQASETRRTFTARQYLGEVLLSMNPRLKKTRHEIQVDCDDHIEIDGYPGAFAQIITNLVMNSLVHAFEPDSAGKIDISLHKQADEIHLTYSDNGRGIPAEHLPKIFDPFFTTKRGCGGTGLGLSVVYNIVVQNFGGTIVCTSEAGQGTTFSIQFPAQGMR
ncbi:MAG: PAS domain S-box protein [Veillonellaceae bacterium]|nr:PAS domain S-box protein [Veillonellaceae bacterium]